LFFDEIDALVPRRDGALSEASSRVVNTLLTELDGLSARDGIYVIAATNRPDIIDPAMLRPGRLEERIFVGLPGPEERVVILQTHIRKTGTEMDPLLADIARLDGCQNFSGADLESLLKKAARLALKRDAVAAAELRKAGLPTSDDSIRVEASDLENAIELVKASVQDVQKYERLRRTLGDN
jgi:ribosome biogenesis ATPase